MAKIEGGARGFSLYVNNNPNRFDFGMGDLRKEFNKAYPELKNIQHMNDIAKIMLAVNYRILTDRTGIEYKKSKRESIKNVCKNVLGID